MLHIYVSIPTSEFFVWLCLDTNLELSEHFIPYGM